MSKSMKNIMLRVIRAKLNEGMDIDEILAQYPKLTKKEVAELKSAL